MIPKEEEKGMGTPCGVSEGEKKLVLCHSVFGWKTAEILEEFKWSGGRFVIHKAFRQPEEGGTRYNCTHARTGCFAGFGWSVEQCKEDALIKLTMAGLAKVKKAIKGVAKQRELFRFRHAQTWEGPAERPVLTGEASSPSPSPPPSPPAGEP